MSEGMKEIYKGSWLDFKRTALGRLKDKDEIVIMTKEELEAIKGGGTPVPYPTFAIKPEERKPEELRDEHTPIGRAMAEDKEPIMGKPDTVKVPKAPAGFKRRLDMILKDNLEHRKHGNKRSGLIDIKHLSRVRTTDRVFERAEDISKKRYNISVLVDCSGSMSGRKCAVARGATMALVRDLQNICALEITTFSHRTEVIKPFGKKVKHSELWNKVGSKIYGSGGNHDHISIKKAAKSLLKQSGQKILLVLSDGQPSCGASAEECDYVCSPMHKHMPDGAKAMYPEEALEHAIRDAEKRGILMLGLGILSSHVNRYYKKCVVINDVENLHGAMIDILNKNVKSLPIG